MSSIYKRLRLAQQSIAGIVKDGHNSFAKYDYVSAEALIRDSRSALHSAGLVLVPAALRIVGEGEERRLDASWEVRDEEGAAVAVGCAWPVVIEKGRPLDKAIAVARTASLGYLLRDLLLLPRVAHEDELDWSGHDEARAGLEQMTDKAPKKEQPKKVEAEPSQAPAAAPAGPPDSPEVVKAIEWLEGKKIANARRELIGAAESWLFNRKDARTSANELTKAELNSVVKWIVSNLKD